MGARETLRIIGGKHYIEYSYFADTPELVSIYYPIGEWSQGYPTDGDEAHGCASGVFSVYSKERRTTYYAILANGGATTPTPSLTRREPVPCPKVRKGIETRWNPRGWWEKRLAKGWTAA